MKSSKIIFLNNFHACKIFAGVKQRQNAISTEDIHYAKYPATHSTAAKGEGSWSASDNSITVTNHSNVGVKATFDYTEEVNTVTGSFSQNPLTLPTALGTTLADAPNGSSNLNLGGTLESTHTGKVGTVTVTITKGA